MHCSLAKPTGKKTGSVKENQHLTLSVIIFLALLFAFAVWNKSCILSVSQFLPHIMRTNINLSPSDRERLRSYLQSALVITGILSVPYIVILPSEWSVFSWCLAAWSLVCEVRHSQLPAMPVCWTWDRQGTVGLCCWYWVWHLDLQCYFLAWCTGSSWSRYGKDGV